MINVSEINTYVERSYISNNYVTKFSYSLGQGQQGRDCGIRTFCDLYVSPVLFCAQRVLQRRHETVAKHPQTPFDVIR